MERNPLLDGTDHINIYSKGFTELGRFLTNFSNHGFTSSVHGYFASVEAYWYWLGCNHTEKERLRHTSGFHSKKLGRELNALDWQESPDFKQNIKNAIFSKIFNYPDMAIKLINSNLPFAHYYNYKGRIIEPEEGKWVIEFITEIRNRLQNCSNLEIKKENLFNAPKGVCLAQSCNTQGDWGAGIALEFKRRFPNSFKEQYNFCKSRNGHEILGNSMVHDEDGYRIASLFTSTGYGRHKSPEDVILCNTLRSIQSLTRDTLIKDIWIPKINSGLFGVSWKKTEIVLKGLLIMRPEVKITVCEI